MPKRRVHRHAVTQPPDQSYRLIPLTQGKSALVDAGDFILLSQWNWHALWNAHTQSFYAVRNYRAVNGKRTIIRMHRVLLGCMNKSDIGDHKNHDTLDNRRGNLRKTTNHGNGRNARKGRGNTSGFKGVVWHKASQRWLAQIGLDNGRRHIGLFDTAEDAARAYDERAKELHGEFAFLNFP